MRLKLALGALLTAGTLACTAAPAAAEWKIACKEGKVNCQLFEQIVDAKTNKTFARLFFHNVAPKGAKQRVVAIYELPLGLFIPSGVTVAIDDTKKSFKAELAECRETEGCRAAFDMTPEILEAMKKGSKIAATIVDARSKRALTFTIALKGFTTAYADFLNLL